MFPQRCSHSLVGGSVSKSCLTLATSWTVAHQPPLSMGFSRQEHWSGLPFPSPGDRPDPWIKPRSPALKVDSCIAGRVFTSWATREAHSHSTSQICENLPYLAKRDFQFSSVMCDSLWPHGLQHARLPCPSPTPGAYSNSCPLHLWCHQTISFSVVPFSHLQSFTASGSFPMSQFFASGGHSIGYSTSASVLPMNIQDWSPLGWTDWIPLQSKGLSRVFSNATVQKYQFFI